MSNYICTCEDCAVHGSYEARRSYEQAKAKAYSELADRCERYRIALEAILAGLDGRHLAKAALNGKVGEPG